MTVTSSIGPVSGIDYGKLLDGLSALDQRPIDKIKTRISTLDDQTAAFTKLSTLITGLKLSAISFTSSAVFRAATASSSNTSVLDATAGIGTPVGSYQLTVQRLAAASQIASQGFTSTTAALGLAGDLTFGFGKGMLDSALKLSDLNGGKGVSRGSIRITDRSGSAAVIDLSKAVDVSDVLDAINNATGVNVKATIDGDKFVLTDRSGGAGNFSIADVGSTTTATELGLVQSVASSTLTGTDINKLALTTSLNFLNNGNGVRTAGILDDFSVTGTTGTANISLNGAKTLGDALAKINAATASTGVTASIAADGHSIALADSGGLTPVVAALNSSNAARDLGLTTATAGAGTLTGDRLNAGLNSALLRDVRGGQGITLGTIHIANRTGGGADVDLSSAKTVSDVLKAINNANAGVSAALNSSGTGILLTDTTGAASGTLAVTDVSGTAAANLGLAQSVSTATLNGGDLHLRYISENTALSTFNAGMGFKAGQIRITNSAGNAFTVNLSGDTITTVNDVITQINNVATGIKASINANGNGILLTDTAGGSLTGKVEEVSGGTTAASLGVLGSFTANALDGSLQKSVTIAATDTLNDIVSKINTANVGASAQIISDGSDSPYRLSLVSRNSGAAGALIFNGDGAGLSSTTLVKGQDAVVLYGNGSGTIAATSATNTLSNLVPSLTVTLQGTGTANITVGRDTSKITDAVKGFVESYNKVYENLAEITKFDSSDPASKGVLFANSTIQQIQQGLGSFLTKTYAGVGPLKTLSAVGITVSQDGKLNLDENKLNSAVSSNLEDVRTLFTTNVKAGPGFKLGKFRITDSAGKTGDVDITSAKNLLEVVNLINQSGTGINASLSEKGDTIILNDIAGGGLTAKVEELNNGTAATSLGLLGSFSGTTRSGITINLAGNVAVQGVGSTLSDVLDRFVNAQTGLIFRSTDEIATQERQLNSRMTSLAELLVAKKNRMIRQFANLEMAISKLQSQGTAISNFKPATTTSK